MELSYKTIRDVLDGTLGDYEYAHEYGEPGYTLEGPTPMVVLGSYWCRCGKHPRQGQIKGGWTGVDSIYHADDLHEYAEHHPRVWATMETQGVEFEWHDEWMIDHDNDKAYRTEPDSYSWQPSYLYTEGGDILTPDDDIEDWIVELQNDPSRCMTRRAWHWCDLEEAGFEQFNGPFESGWFEGQNDDPKMVTDAIRRQYDDDVDILFYLNDTGQFDVRFTAWIRPTQTDTEE